MVSNLTERGAGGSALAWGARGRPFESGRSDIDYRLNKERL